MLFTRCMFGVAEASLCVVGMVQEKGRLEIKVTTLGDENRKLQHTILQLEKQRKDTESQNVSVNSKAAKVQKDCPNGSAEIATG